MVWGGLAWSGVVCGGLRWSGVVCGDLGWSAVQPSIRIFPFRIPVGAPSSEARPARSPRLATHHAVTRATPATAAPTQRAPGDKGLGGTLDHTTSTQSLAWVDNGRRRQWPCEGIDSTIPPSLTFVPGSPRSMSLTWSTGLVPTSTPSIRRMWSPGLTPASNAKPSSAPSTSTLSPSRPMVSPTPPYRPVVRSDRSSACCTFS